jgi:hypothetical protein
MTAERSISVKRWKNAVFNLEVTMRAVSETNLSRLWWEASEKAIKKEDNTELRKRYEEERLRLMPNEKRMSGTGILYQDNGQYYILTARHVVADELTAQDELFESQLRFSERSPQQPLNPHEQERAYNTIAHRIFVVPTLGIEPTNLSPRNWMIFPTNFRFAPAPLDLAIIRLGLEDERFLKTLSQRGIVAIQRRDIEASPRAEFDEVFTIGFPSAMSLVGQRDLHPALAHWESSSVSLPHTTSGRVSLLHEKLQMFKADLPVYPGNSGGPVIADDKLVGIVIQQPAANLEGLFEVRREIMNDPRIRAAQSKPEFQEMLGVIDAVIQNLRLSGSYRLPFTIAVKGKYLLELIDGYRKDEDNWAEKEKRLKKLDAEQKKESDALRKARGSP